MKNQDLKLGYKSKNTRNRTKRLNTQYLKAKNRIKRYQKDKKRLQGQFRDLSNSRLKWRTESLNLRQELQSKNRTIRFLENRFLELESKDSNGKLEESTLLSRLDYLEKENAALSAQVLSLKRKEKDFSNKLMPCLSNVYFNDTLLSGLKKTTGSTYDLWQVEASICLYLTSSIGFRCLSKVWEVFSIYLKIGSPSYGVIRQWVLRIGLYKLQQEVEKASDWVYIVDYSIQMGREHCLVILGFRLEVWRAQSSQNLRHKDVQVLDLIVTEHPNGEEVKARLSAVMERTGVPQQIISDRGSKIKLGRDSFIASIEEKTVIGTFDISHLIANRLKSLLSENAEWLEMTKAVNSVQKRTQQSTAGFLAPISLRKTARYMNIYAYANYLEKIMAFEAIGDFNLLANEWRVDKNSIKCIKNQSVKKKVLALRTHTKKDLERAINAYKIKSSSLIFHHNGAKEFAYRFGQLSTHYPFIKDIISLTKWLKCFQKDLKTNGLSKQQVLKWTTQVPLLRSTFITKFWSPLMDLLQQQADLLPDEQIYLATSDIIESFFGKYKSKVSSFWLKGMSSLVLMMPALAGSMDRELIVQALEKVSMKDVEQWFYNQRDTASFLSKRRQAFESANQEIKQQQENVTIIKQIFDEQSVAA